MPAHPPASSDSDHHLQEVGQVLFSLCSRPAQLPRMASSMATMG